jgi:hypothetical protein
MVWDGNLYAFSTALEAAGQRADQLRARAMRRLMAAQYAKRNGWPW